MADSQSGLRPCVLLPVTEPLLLPFDRFWLVKGKVPSSSSHGPTRASDGLLIQLLPVFSVVLCTGFINIKPSQQGLVVPQPRAALGHYQ